MDHARLVNAALMAKIHTVEWTPSLLADSDLETGMRLNWWGLQGEGAWRRFGRLSKSEEMSGIPGSQLYYRRRALLDDRGVRGRLPDAPSDPGRLSHLFRGRRQADRRDRLYERSGKRTPTRCSRIPASTWRTCSTRSGRSNPGAIVLHNFPNHLQHFTETDGTLIDLATVDIVLSPERGVKRYNEFRRNFYLTCAPVRRLQRRCPGCRGTAPDLR